MGWDGGGRLSHACAHTHTHTHTGLGGAVRSVWFGYIRLFSQRQFLPRVKKSSSSLQITPHRHGIDGMGRGWTTFTRVRTYTHTHTHGPWWSGTLSLVRIHSFVQSTAIFTSCQKKFIFIATHATQGWDEMGWDGGGRLSHACAHTHTRGHQNGGRTISTHTRARTRTHAHTHLWQDS